jgi:hypothetical protein
MSYWSRLSYWSRRCFRSVPVRQDYSRTLAIWQHDLTAIRIKQRHLLRVHFRAKRRAQERIA